MPSRKSKKSRKSKRKVVLPHPEKGAMGKYSTTLPRAKRHSILCGLVNKHGYASVIRDLNLRATLNKHNKTPHGKMREDMEWLRAEYR